MTQFTWQKAQWKQCVFLEKSYKMPQALLLSGIQGLGKRQFAQALGKWLFCLSDNKFEREQACGVCQSCQWMDSKQHPEWFVISPENNPSISIDQIRELTTVLQLTPQYAKKKWVVIEECDKLTVAASHALLKILEEPTDTTGFILVTSHKKKLLATIKSRVIDIQFSPPTESKIHIDFPEIPIWALRMAQGAPLEALEWIKPEFIESRTRFIQALENVENGGNAIQAADIWMKSSQKSALFLFYYWLIDLVYLTNHSDSGPIIFIDQLERLQDLSKKCSAQGLLLLLSQLEQILKTKLQVSACNDQLCFERVLTQYTQLMGFVGADLRVGP